MSDRQFDGVLGAIGGHRSSYQKFGSKASPPSTWLRASLAGRICYDVRELERYLTRLKTEPLIEASEA
ncbi:hypothetical protein CKA32_003015 [Geitlerinema sp. FC II]|nr:hypothetical protein CKA32_003015 [Geitlerinema sp. FC II]